jgi:hypothetical protein
MAIGDHIGDAIRNIEGRITPSFGGSDSPWTSIYSDGSFANIYISSTVSIPYGEPITAPIGAKFSAAFVVPTAYENRPGSISAYLCIKY